MCALLITTGGAAERGTSPFFIVPSGSGSPIRARALSALDEGADLMRR